MSKMGWFGVVRPNYSKSSKVTGNITTRQNAHEFVLAFHSNYVPIVYRF